MVIAGCTFCALAAVVASGSPKAQSNPADIKKTVDSTLTIERETQQRQERWAAERNEFIARYKTAKAAIGYLAERKATTEERLAGIESAAAELERSLRESSRLQRNLQDTLGAIYTRLEHEVRSDLPFLSAERETRLVSLKSELARPAEAGGEKLRRVLEALQVETSYGSGVEVTQERIVRSSDTLFVDLLRLGRLSLYYRTTDGKKIGEYDRGSGTWRELPGKYARNIGLAIDMATRTRPVEIVSLPIGRIQP
jgi:hypothetical protein